VAHYIRDINIFLKKVKRIKKIQIKNSNNSKKRGVDM